MHFRAAIDFLRSDSLSEHEKGARFERCIKAWLLADPTYASGLTDVWLWSEFPAKGEFGDRDLGIDLVARTDQGGYWAIQCKFYAQETSIDKPAVDSFISNSGRIFHDPTTGQETTFAARYWISTSDVWTENAQEIIRHQEIPFQRVTWADLQRSVVDWQALLQGTPEQRAVKAPMAHQQEALEHAHAYYADHDRGKLIMACGTGKTYTALLIAEQEVPKGSVLFLVPSISLLNQSLNAWMADTQVPMKAICICSDATANRKKSASEDATAESLTELALPATTRPREIVRRYVAYQHWLDEQPQGLLVVFSTYQSIEAVATAQQAISQELGTDHVFDLIVCDEAHRTTGILDANNQSDFTKIHDNTYLRGRKRLYMTATPRIYADNVKTRVKQSDFELCSMDDVSLYGEEFFRVDFAYAVANKLLTDYKVLVLTVGSEHQLPPTLTSQVHDPHNKELSFDFVSRLLGCINGLAKNTNVNSSEDSSVWDEDPRTMRRAIAFCPNIDKKGDPSSSKNTARQLPMVAEALFAPDIKPMEGGHRLRIAADHIDGSMDSGLRAQKLAWLAEETDTTDECRVLCNVRCLSEGIDVPALDAAIFLSQRNSQVDVVQSVGRVMRNFHRGMTDEKNSAISSFRLWSIPISPPKKPSTITKVSLFSGVFSTPCVRTTSASMR